MFLRLAAGFLSAALAVFAPASPAAAGGDEVFFEKVVGQWTGPGEIVAGKYKGTKFVCSLAGEPQGGTLGMALDGYCRVGLFSQKMRAAVSRQDGSYKGAFLDGALGKGLDIVSGTVAGDSMVVGLDRKQLKGAMVAKLQNPDTLNISISVRVAGSLVPVIGMSLKRDEAPVKQTSLAR